MEERAEYNVGKKLCKNNLKNGRFVKFKNGEICLYFNKTIWKRTNNDDYLPVCDIDLYDKDLKFVYDAFNGNYDIIKILETTLDWFDEDCMEIICEENKINKVNELQSGDIFIHKNGSKHIIIIADGRVNLMEKFEFVLSYSLDKCSNKDIKEIFYGTIYRGSISNDNIIWSNV